MTETPKEAFGVERKSFNEDSVLRESMLSIVELDNKYNPKKSCIKILLIDIFFSVLDIVATAFLARWHYWIVALTIIFVVGLIWQLYNLYLISVNRVHKRKDLNSLQYYVCWRLFVEVCLFAMQVYLIFFIIKTLVTKSEVPSALSSLPGGWLIYLSIFVGIVFVQLVVQNIIGPKYYRHVKHWEAFDGLLNISQS